MRSFTHFTNDTNKENINCNAQRPPYKRFKRLPLQEQQPNIQEFTFNSQPAEVIPEKSKSLREELILPRNLSQLYDDKQQKNIMDFENKLEIQSTTKKRNEKLNRKLYEEESKSMKEEPIRVCIDTSESRGSANDEINRKENIPAINQQQDKEIDSLMDATYHSATSGPQGVQYQGRWTPEEHQKFMEGLKMFGKDWRKIEEYIGSRTCAQIRSHAQKYFNRIQRDVAKGIPHKDASVAEKLGKPKKTLQKVEAPQNPPMTPQQNDILIESQTNQQIQQIHETLQKLTEEDLLINLQQLIAQREFISMELLLRRSTMESACERMIIIANRFHQLAMTALKACKFEICNRMIDERNLTQFTCILLSKQIVITPIEENLDGQEIIQHVKLSPQNSIHDHFHSLGRESLSQITLNNNGRDTAKTSPNSLNQRKIVTPDDKKNNIHE